MERSAGVLMHITSLPSPYGVGTMGKAAYEFADFLAAAGQRYWQMLPLGHTGYGDSPYQCFSMYAGNPNLIDLDMLAHEGLLSIDEIAAVNWGGDPGSVDYGAVYRGREPLFRMAFERTKRREDGGLSDFRAKNRDWIEDYALFMAIKKRFDMRSWLMWEDEAIRLRDKDAVNSYARELSEDVEFYIFVQYLFRRQWDALREYVSSRGILLIGDLPIYLSADSAEVWCRPECFKLDENRYPAEVAGVPPDEFTDDGQLWGNPLYDWDYLRENGYGLWLDRLRAAFEMFDVVRLDHFRGLESYWSVPYGETTAKNGRWVEGPGMDFIAAIKNTFPGRPIIAEDLGYLTEGTKKLLAESGFPGMKVLMFAFYSREPSSYLPHLYPHNCVCYVGTHDNPTAVGWYSELYDMSRDLWEYARDYMALSLSEGVSWGLIRTGLSSPADLFVAQMQDYLSLPAGARMNTPGTPSGNWRWRVMPGALTPELAGKIAYLTRLYGR